jgi:hypothetical protein
MLGLQKKKNRLDVFLSDFGALTKLGEELELAFFPFFFLFFFLYIFIYGLAEWSSNVGVRGLLCF